MVRKMQMVNLIDREPSSILLISPDGMDPVSWLPVKSLIYKVSFMISIRDYELKSISIF
jgi:hypothetical protein